MMKKCMFFILLFMLLLCGYCYLATSEAHAAPLIPVIAALGAGGLAAGTATAVGVGTALGAGAAAAGTIGAVAIGAGVGLTASALSEQKRAQKSEKASQQAQYNSMMAAQSQQAEATRKQMQAANDVQNQTALVGRQTRRRANSGDPTETILTPLGSNTTAKNTLGG